MGERGMRWLISILLSLASTAAADHNWDHRDILRQQNRKYRPSATGLDQSFFRQRLQNDGRGRQREDQTDGDRDLNAQSQPNPGDCDESR